MSHYDRLSRYYADDKDVRDILEGRVGKSMVPRLMRPRGLLLNPDIPPADFHEVLGLFIHSHSDVVGLLEAVEWGGRGPSQTSKRMSTSLTLREIKSALNKVKRARKKEHNEVWRINATKTALSVTVTYSEFDWKRTRLFQKVVKDVPIDIEPAGHDVWTIRSTATDRSTQIIEAIEKQMKSDSPAGSFKVSHIGLGAIADPGLRTQFLFDLMSSLPGFTVQHVLEVAFSPVGASAATIPSGAVVAASLTKAVLKGTSINKTEEYLKIQNSQGSYYVAKAVWAMDEGPKGPRFECEAGFTDGPNADGFSYRVRSVYSRITQGDRKGQLRTTKAKPRTDEVAKICNLIESAAEAAQATVLAAAQGSGSTS